MSHDVNSKCHSFLSDTDTETLLAVIILVRMNKL